MHFSGEGSLAFTIYSKKAGLPKIKNPYKQKIRHRKITDLRARNRPYLS